MVHWAVSVLRSFVPAWAGLCWALRTQRNLQVHAIATVTVITGGWWFRIERWEWCAVIAVSGLVWSAELLNTALEVLADRVSREREEPIRRVKDVAAAAVLMAALAALGVGFAVFAPRLWSLVENVPPSP